MICSKTLYNVITDNRIQPRDIPFNIWNIVATNYAYLDICYINATDVLEKACVLH